MKKDDVKDLIFKELCQQIDVDKITNLAIAEVLSDKVYQGIKTKALPVETLFDIDDDEGQTMAVVLEDFY